MEHIIIANFDFNALTFFMRQKPTRECTYLYLSCTNGVSGSSLIRLSPPRGAAMSLPCREDKPHRKANTCQGIYKEMISCYQRSKCMNEMGYSLQQCMDSMEPKIVGNECIMLHTGYRECRYMLLSPTLRFRGNKYGGSF